MVTQFSLLGLHSLTSPGGTGRETTVPTITGPRGRAHSTLVKNQSKIPRGVYVGAGKTPALALLNWHLLTRVYGS